MFDNVFPGFVLEAISGYVRTKSYSIGNMEEREREIKTKAEEVVNQTLSFPKRIIFNWLLFHARRGTDYASTCVCHDNTEILRGFQFSNLRTSRKSHTTIVPQKLNTCTYLKMVIKINPQISIFGKTQTHKIFMLYRYM